MTQPVPAPGPSPAQLANPLPVIDTKYCAPHLVVLAVVKKIRTISNGDFVVTDSNGTLIFKVKGKLMSLHDHRVLVDASGEPIVTLREKIRTAHHRWNVYRGESKEASDLIFTVKRTSMIQLTANLDVFLANKTEEEVCDFKVIASWAQRRCTISTGDPSNIIATMSKQTSIQSVLFGKDNFSVTIHPNVDHAFIISLIVILKDMEFLSHTGRVFIKTSVKGAAAFATSGIVS